jgi:hypothetical protein
MHPPSPRDARAAAAAGVHVAAYYSYSIDASSILALVNGGWQSGKLDFLCAGEKKGKLDFYPSAVQAKEETTFRHIFMCSLTPYMFKKNYRFLKNKQFHL